MFGKDFERMDASDIAKPGEYDIIIKSVHEREKKGYHFLEFGFEYADGWDRQPKTFSLFENTAEQGEKGRIEFCRRATKIFDCFNLKEGFDEQTRSYWIGARGRVEIGEDKKGFTVVKKFLPSASAQERNFARNAPTLDSAGQDYSIY